MKSRIFLALTGIAALASACTSEPAPAPVQTPTPTPTVEATPEAPSKDYLTCAGDAKGHLRRTINGGMNFDNGRALIDLDDTGKMFKNSAGGDLETYYWAPKALDVANPSANFDTLVKRFTTHCGGKDKVVGDVPAFRAQFRAFSPNS